MLENFIKKNGISMKVAEVLDCIFNGSNVLITTGGSEASNEKVYERD